MLPPTEGALRLRVQVRWAGIPSAIIRRSLFWEIQTRSGDRVLAQASIADDVPGGGLGDGTEQGFLLRLPPTAEGLQLVLVSRQGANWIGTGQSVRIHSIRICPEQPGSGVAGLCDRLEARLTTTCIKLIDATCLRP